MTSQQKIVITRLLEGCTIAALGSSGYRLRSPQGNVLMKVKAATFRVLRHGAKATQPGSSKRVGILRRLKSGLFVIDLNRVRQWHGRSFVKKEYLKFQNIKNQSNEH